MSRHAPPLVIILTPVSISPGIGCWSGSTQTSWETSVIRLAEISCLWWMGSLLRGMRENREFGTTYAMWKCVGGLLQSQSITETPLVKWGTKFFNWQWDQPARGSLLHSYIHGMGGSCMSKRHTPCNTTRIWSSLLADFSLPHSSRYSCSIIINKTLWSI